MSRFSSLYRGETNIGFVGQSGRWFKVSAVVLAICLLSLGVRGLNLSIDFRGGLALDAPNPAGASVGDIRDVLAPFGFEDARVLEIDDGASIRVQTEAVDVETNVG